MLPAFSSLYIQAPGIPTKNVQIVDQTRFSPVSAEISISDQLNALQSWCREHLPYNKLALLDKIFAIFLEQYYNLDEIVKLTLGRMDIL